MSCGQIALNRLGIKIDNYYASEIDKYAITVTQHNYPNTIQLGDITQWKSWDIDWSSTDLIIGGSPCQGFSVAGKRLNFDDERSKLYFVFEDILKYVKPKWWLLENVVMLQKWQDIISQRLGIRPIMIDSALVSAAHRKRLYWTNISNQLDMFGFPYCTILQPKDKQLYLKDIMVDDCSELKHRDITNVSRYKTDSGVKLDINKKLNFPTSSAVFHYTKKYGTLMKSKASLKIFCKCNDNLIRHPTANEWEKMQTVPEYYTNVNKMSQSNRKDMLGNGMTIDILTHILGHINNG